MDWKRNHNRNDHVNGHAGQPDLKAFVEAVDGRMPAGRNMQRTPAAGRMSDQQNKLIDIHNLRK